MSILDERVNVIAHGSILGQSMSRIDTKVHNHIEFVTEMFLKGGGKIQVVPMGATSDSNPLRPGSDSRQQEAIKRRIKKSK